MGLALRSPLWSDPRRKPPFGSVEVDFEHPLARGLTGAILYPFDKDLVSGVKVLPASGSGQGPKPEYFRTNSQNYWAPQDSSQSTIAVDLRFESDPNTSAAIQYSYFVSNTDRQSIGLYWEDTNTRFVIVFSRNSASQNSGTGNPIISTTFPVVGQLIGTYDWGAGSAVVYQNLVQVANTGPAGTYAADSRKRMRVSEIAQWGVKYFYLWNRLLGETERAWLFAEPYVFFRPIVRRRWFVPAAAPPAGGLPTRRLLMDVG